MGKQKKHVFVARLARHAAATVMVGAGVMPPGQTAMAASTPLVAQEYTVCNPAVFPQAEPQASSSQSSFIVRIQPEQPSEWDKKTEREFRALALLEAKGQLSAESAARLETLSDWREQLLCPRTVEETLLQIKRDRLLGRMETLLQEYVEFQEAANQARSAS